MTSRERDFIDEDDDVNDLDGYDEDDLYDEDDDPNDQVPDDDDDPLQFF